MIGVILGGFLAGLIHVLSGPDHLTAVAPYAMLERTRAWRVGLRWGLGHTGGVMVIGLLTLLLRKALSIEFVSAGSERLVGVVLILIGIWGWRKAATTPVEDFTPASEDQKDTEASSANAHLHKHPHTHAAFGVGLLHGLAGSSHLLGILPALALPSTAAAGAWLLLFGTGTVLGMMAFATVIGLAGLRFLAAGGRFYKGVLYLCAVAAIGVGLFWLFVGGA